MKTRHPDHPDEVWVHIDEPDAPDGKVWAVQWYSRAQGRWLYSRVRAVHCYARGFQGIPLPGRQQPRFVIRLFYVSVEMRFGRARILKREVPA